MTDPAEDLRATSEAIQDDAQRLKDLEVEKQALDPTDPAVVDLSREIERLVRAISTKASAERALSEELQGG